MSYLLKVVCTASVLLLVLAEVAMSVSIKVPPRINLARRLSGARVKRQSQQCINVLSGIESDPKWTTCITITEKLSNVSTITNTQIQNYCQQHCPTLEVQDFKAIVAACGTSLIPGSERLLGLETFILQSCDHSPTNHYCMQDWKDLDTIFTSQEQLNYSQCINEYKTTKDCTSSCRSSTASIKNKLGCCYKSLADYELSSQGDGQALPDEVFKRCNQSAPTLCLY